MGSFGAVFLKLGATRLEIKLAAILTNWRLALGVTASIVLVYAVTREVADWWWLLPLAVAALLAVSVNDATRPRRR